MWGSVGCQNNYHVLLMKDGICRQTLYKAVKRHLWSTDVTLLAAIKHLCSTVLSGFRRVVFLVRKKWRLLTTAHVNGSILIWWDTRQRWNSSFHSLLFTSMELATWANFKFRTVVSESSELHFGNDENTYTGRECRKTTLHSSGNMSQMQRSLKDVLKKAAAAWS